jgi:hypothetical protein
VGTPHRRPQASTRLDQFRLISRSAFSIASSTGPSSVGVLFDQVGHATEDFPFGWV